MLSLPDVPATQHTSIGKRHAQPCDCCGQLKPRSAPLINEKTGMTLHTCMRCLRSTMRMQAPRADPKGRIRLRTYAERLGWHVWRGGDILYLLPAVGPFATDHA